MSILQYNMKTQTSPKILIVAGGTGGHIFPAIATGRAITALRTAAPVSYLCGTRPLECELYAKQNITPLTMVARHFGGGIIAKICGLFALIANIVRCVILLRTMRPAAVVGFGGYVTGPAMIAAWLLRIPRLVHESNAIIGKTNRILLRFVDVCATTYEQTVGIAHDTPNVRAVGMPIINFPHPNRQESYAHFDLSPARRTLLIVGGSQGAQLMYEKLAKIFQHLRTDTDLAAQWQVLWSAGAGNYEWLSAIFANAQQPAIPVKILPFISEMHHALAVADMAVCRAGSSTVAEIIAARILPIFVPLPTAIYNHQFLNAQAAIAHTGGLLMQQAELDEAPTCAQILKDAMIKLPKPCASTTAHQAQNAANAFAQIILSSCGQCAVPSTKKQCANASCEMSE